MRWALALLLCSAALAGCTAGDDNPNPPNADPYPSESYPPSSASTTPPSTETHTNPPPSNSTSSSGTTTASAGHLAAQNQEDSATDPDFSGLMLGGHLAGSGAAVHVDAAANNFGERTFRVPDGCRTPWTETLAGPSGAVQARQPSATCAAESWRDLPAHDSLARTFEWNGTLWDAGAGRYVPAPAGTYSWHISFDVYAGSGSPPPEHTTLTLEFQVTVT